MRIHVDWNETRLSLAGGSPDNRVLAAAETAHIKSSVGSGSGGGVE